VCECAYVSRSGLRNLPRDVIHAAKTRPILRGKDDCKYCSYRWTIDRCRTEHLSVCQQETVRMPFGGTGPPNARLPTHTHSRSTGSCPHRFGCIGTTSFGTRVSVRPPVSVHSLGSPCISRADTDMLYIARGVGRDQACQTGQSDD
jgi:hypothetical protein